MLKTRRRWVRLALAAALCISPITCTKKDHRRRATPAAPEVYSVAPAGGSVLGGGTVTVFTRNFRDDFTVCLPEVLFGSVPAVTVIVVTPTELVVTVSPGPTPGPVDVTVNSTCIPETATCVGCYDYEPPPTCRLTGIAPDSGDVSGGEVVTVSGQDFVPNPTVYFGTDQALWAFTQDASTIVAMTPPARVLGDMDVTVDLPNRSNCVLPGGYAYAHTWCDISDLTPSTGLTLGGELFTIGGSGFHWDATVEFGGVPATNVTLDPAGYLWGYTPDHVVPGPVEVEVINPDGPCFRPVYFEYVVPQGGCSLGPSWPPAGGTGGGVHGQARPVHQRLPQPPPGDRVRLVRSVGPIAPGHLGPLCGGFCRGPAMAAAAVGDPPCHHPSDGAVLRDPLRIPGTGTRFPDNDLARGRRHVGREYRLHEGGQP